MSEESTTPDPVELTRRWFEAVNRRDLDAAQRFLAADAVWEAVSLGTSFEGAEAIRGFFEDWIGAYGDHEMNPEEVLAVGTDVVFVVVRLTVRLAGSTGSELTRRRPLTFVWAEGLIGQITAHASSVQEGRAAAEQLAQGRR